MYHNVSQCIAMYHNVSQSITIYHNVSQSVVLTISTSLRPVISQKMLLGNKSKNSATTFL